MKYRDDEIKLPWLNPLADSTVTINAHDSEYLTVCVSDTDQGRFSMPFNTGIMNEFYTVGKEKNSVDAQIRISAANAKKDTKCITIRKTPNEKGKTVFFKSSD
ncbi:MAG: hypothetical protein WBF33_31915 [Candidatus Nitrosopolaris sp.]